MTAVQGGVPPTATMPRAYVPLLTGLNFGTYLVLLTPVLVSMAFKIQHITTSAAAATQWLGLVLGVGALVALFVNPLAGRLSDRTRSRFGRRRPWMVGGVLIGLLGAVIIGLATSVWVVLLAWCLVQAAMNGVLAAAYATVADLVPPARRGKVSGVIGLGLPLGIVVGSALITVLPQDLLRFLVPSLVAIGFTALFVLVLPDRVLTARPGPLTVREFFGSFVFDPCVYRDFGWTWLTKFMINFGYAGVATFLPFYLTERFSLPEQQALTVLLIANLASMVGLAISSPIGGFLSDRIGRRKPFVAAAGFIIVVGLVVLAFAQNIVAIVVGQGIIGLGAGSFIAVDLALATQVLPNETDTAKDLGVLNIANTLPQSLAPALAPLIIGIGSATALGGYPVWFLFGAVVSLLGVALVHRIKGVA